jgi:hypothetical protein
MAADRANSPHSAALAADHWAYDASVPSPDSTADYPGWPETVNELANCRAA